MQYIYLISAPMALGAASAPEETLINQSINICDLGPKF